MPHPLQNATAEQADLELAKWLAVITMVIDHYGQIVEPDLFLQTHAIGRVSFPLFATIVGMRLAVRPAAAAGYVKRLLPWALISQPVYVVAGRYWYDGNILFTLLLGVLATMLIRRFVESRQPHVLAVALALIPVAWFVDFGIVGAAMISITVALAARCWLAGLLASGPLGVAANLTLTSPPIQLVDTAALLASGIALTSAKARIRLPRLPTHLFYAFYPAHLLALHFLDLSMQGATH